MKKTMLFLALVAVLIPPAVYGTGQQTAIEQQRGTVVVWSWVGNHFAGLAEVFNRKFPEIKIDHVPVGQSEYLQKIQTALAAGGDLPDIGAQEIGARGRLFALNCWEPLERPPYNFDRRDVFDYLIPLTINKQNEVVGIEWTVSPAALAYHRDVAKLYFGTDDPEEMRKAVPDWDKFIQKGIEILKKSDGQVKMLLGPRDAYRIIYSQIAKPVIEDNKVDMKSGPLPQVLRWLIKMRDAGVVDKLKTWAPAWNAAHAEKRHMFFLGANWSPSSVIKPNDKEGSGNWGLMIPPVGAFSYGGTSLGIISKSKNKEQAWTFIKWLLLTKEGAEANKQLIGYYVGLKSAYTEAFVTQVDPFFGNQDIGKLYLKTILPKLKVRPVSEYDPAVLDVINLMTDAIMNNPNLTYDAALGETAAELKKKLPGVTILN